MIAVKELSKKFGDEWALKKTTWSALPGRSVGLLGPNGAGKSTTMKIMTGLLCASEGGVLVDGESIMDHPLSVKRKIGYLPENPPLYNELKVYDFLDFVCGLKSIAHKQRKAEIDGAIEKLQLEKVIFKPIAFLSKGFRQRVGIAQALLGSPSILILDEPSVGLDPQQVFELRKTIQTLMSEHIVILSTHVLSEVQEICDDVVILDRGEIKAMGSMTEILALRQTRSVVEIQVDRSNNKLVESLESLPNTEAVKVCGNQIQLFLQTEVEEGLNIYLQEIIKSGCQVHSVRPKQQKLEDVFIEVVR